MPRHREDAEDLTQQTFIKALRYFDRVDPDRPVIHWLITIARNSALNHFRDTPRWAELKEDDASSQPSPAHQAENRDRVDNLWEKARQLLKPREYEVMWLRFAEELSIADIARTVGLTQIHVKVIVHRARQRLLKGETHHEHHVEPSAACLPCRPALERHRLLAPRGNLRRVRAYFASVGTLEQALRRATPAAVAATPDRAAVSSSACAVLRAHPLHRPMSLARTAGGSLRPHLRLRSPLDFSGPRTRPPNRRPKPQLRCWPLRWKPPHADSSIP